MPLTPEEISSRKFNGVYGRGYDRGEVDAFLATVAKDYSAALQRIALEAEGRMAVDDMAAEVEGVLRAARESAQRIKHKAREEAERRRTETEEWARKLQEESEKAHAHATNQAETEATTIVESAERYAEQLRESSARDQEELLVRAHERFAALLKHEEQLRERIDRLRQLVEEMQVELEPVDRIDLAEIEAAEEVRHGQEAAADRPEAEIWVLEENHRTAARDKERG